VTCADLEPLLHGYVDGELDLVRHLDVERHLQGCPACAAACEALQGLQAALLSPSFRFEPPPGLRRRIESSLGDADFSRPRRRPWPLLALAASAALFALGALGAWGAVHAWSARTEDRLAREVVSSHVRSLMLDSHRLDVASSDQHTVKPWFHGKLDFAPAVPDLTGQGFALLGGRLDYLDNRPVAALVYQRRKHVINLLTWSSPDAADEGPAALTRQGYHIVYWSRGGLTCWAVSDLNAQELRTFADLLIERTAASAP
jgi:anti-sigma factor RsiW